MDYAVSRQISRIPLAFSTQFAYVGLSRDYRLHTMAIKTGEPISAKVQDLLKMEKDYSVGAFASLPGFIVSGKGSTLVVSKTQQPCCEFVA